MAPIDKSGILGGAAGSLGLGQSMTQARLARLDAKISEVERLQQSGKVDQVLPDKGAVSHKMEKAATDFEALLLKQKE